VNDSERDVALHSAALVVLEMVPSFLYPLSLTISLSQRSEAQRSAAVVEIGLNSCPKLIVAPVDGFSKFFYCYTEQKICNCRSHYTSKMSLNYLVKYYFSKIASTESTAMAD